MRNFVLDACAVLAAFAKEDGFDKVEHILKLAEDYEAYIEMHAINVLEVYYNVLRSKGQAIALDAINKIEESSVQIINNFSKDLLVEAGRLKTAYHVSLADSIALAYAFLKDSELVTSDHHEFDVIENKENIKFFWIR